MELEFSRLLLEKYSDIKCHENPLNGSRIIPRGHTDGQTDRHYKANYRVSTFC